MALFLQKLSDELSWAFLLMLNLKFLSALFFIYIQQMDGEPGYFEMKIEFF